MPRRCRPPSPAPLRQPLGFPAPGTLLLHHPSRVEGQGHPCQLPEGLHGRGCHAWQSTVSRQTASTGAATKPATTHPGGPAATQRVSFSDPLVSPPSCAAWRRSRNHFSPTLQRGFCMPWTGGTLIASANAVSAMTADSAQEVGPLTSSPPSQRQSSGGVLWRRISDHCRHAVHSDRHLVPVLCCTVPVYKPLCIWNKPVMS
jgi:hypothetical protein